MDKKIEIGVDDPIVVDKVFGPMVFASLKIEADYNRGWIIYRQWACSGDWIEWCTIPAQIEQEFTSATTEEE